MKTLDEVIKGFECCKSIECKECPYRILFNDDSHVPCDQFEKDDDALHYLKEYRSEKAMWKADRKRFLDWIEQYKESREKHQQAVIELKKNPPLTWDELKRMEGKPVWVEYTSDGKGEWTIIRIVEENNLIDDIGVYPREDIGKTWQAYRKERK